MPSQCYASNYATLELFLEAIVDLHQADSVRHLNPDQTGMLFAERTVHYHPLIGQPLSVSLSSVNQQVAFDEIALSGATVTAPVPSLSRFGIMILLSLLGMTILRRSQAAAV